MSATLTAEETLKLVGEIFVYHMPFNRALGLELDASGYGMGVRSKRFALYAEDGIVRGLWVEAPGEFRVSSAEYVLAHLPT